MLVLHLRMLMFAPSPDKINIQCIGYRFFLSLAILKYFLYDYKGNRNDSVLTQNNKNNSNKYRITNRN